MADLMSAGNAPKKLYRGQEVEGTVISVSDREIILDLGTKAEGLMSKNDLPQDKRDQVKVGDNLKAFIIAPENESGQVVLTLQKELTFGTRMRNVGGKKGIDLKKWQKFFQARDQKTTVSGKVLEANKGGVVVDVDGMRGFLPTSQINLSKITGEIIGQNLKLYVIEIDINDNRLILSTRGKVDEETLAKIAKLEVGQEILGKIVSIAPFGLIVDLNGVEGIIYSQELSWTAPHKDGAGLENEFELGQEIKAKISSIDESTGRVNLSVRQMEEDPFADLVKDLQPDDVVSGLIKEVTQNEVVVQLDGVEGIVPVSKIEQGKQYIVGEKNSFTIDNIDTNKRKINLAPFLTSTKGLIYK
ncbi:MAG: S1 RNA-binding domain-containing protein [Candidatus Daviesbacteria bacterium]|nr:S1 RNA-binding domain-containing protein [Candidatus Daviesbacteria bacterium]